MALPLNYLPPLAGALYDFLLAGLCFANAVAQLSGDFSDLKHPSPHPWYLSRGCSGAWPQNRVFCHAAQASFVLVVIAGILYAARLALGLAQAARVPWLGGLLRSEDPGRYEDCGDGWFDGPKADEYEALRQEDMEMRISLQGEPLSPVLAFFP